MRITIAGAGPIGCYLGQLLKRCRLSPVILEEHPEIGVPQHCAGLVGSTFFDQAEIPLPREVIKKEINGAIISHQDQSFILEREGAAFVIDREKMDKKLSSGLDIKKETTLISLEKGQEEYLLHTDRGTFRSDLVIGADGATSTFRKVSGVKLEPTYYTGTQFRVRQKIKPCDMVQVHFTKPFLHFCWVIPEDEDIVRVGSICPKGSSTNLRHFMERMRIKGEIIEKMGGTLSVGYGETSRGGIALVGDAACQVKPLTGGGLYYGMRCAEILANCIKEGKLSSYDAEWKKQIGREIHRALRIRKILEKTNVKFLHRLFSLAQKNSHLIEELADFEHHSTSIFAVVKKLGLIFPGLLSN